MEPLTPTMTQRRRLNIPLNFQPKRNVLHPETEKKLTEIMKRNGLIKVNGIDYKTAVTDLEDQGELGNGTSGHVVKMKHKATGTIIAVKQMRRTGNDEENKRIIMDLDVVLKSHNCPYIVQCLGCFITEADVWIVMELMSTCFDKLQKRTKLPIPENILRHITECTVRALSYLKDTHGVIHRDVKPSNILIDEKGDIKLCDFGISGRLVDSKAKTRSAGCAAYMAPERIDPKKPEYDIRADVWSLGITLVELATGHYPYRGCKTDFEVLTKVLEADPPRLPVDEGFSDEFQDFVAQCLTKNYHKRPKYPELLRHPFLNYDPSLRVDVGEWFQRICDNAGIELPRQELPQNLIPPQNRLSSLPLSPELHHDNPFLPANIPNIANTIHTTNINNYNPFVSSSVDNFSLPTENVASSSTITTTITHTQGLYHQYKVESDAESQAQRKREQKESAINDIQNMIKTPRLAEDQHYIVDQQLANEMHKMYPQKSPYLVRKNSFEPNIPTLNNLGSSNSPYLQRKHNPAFDYLLYGGPEPTNGGSKYQQLQPQQQPHIATLSPVVKKRYVSGKPISEDLQYRHLHGNTSPIVLQRFFHQQSQLRAKEEEESPPILAPRYREEYAPTNQFRNPSNQSPLLNNFQYVQQQYPRQQQSASPMRQLRNPAHEPIYHPQIQNHFTSQNYVRNEIHHQPQHPQHHQHPPHIAENHLSHIPVYQYKAPSSPYQKIGPEPPASPYLDRIRLNMKKLNFYDQQQAPFEANGRENGVETNGNSEQIKEENGWLNSFTGVVKRRIAATYMQFKLKNEPKDKKDKAKSLAQVSPLHKTMTNIFAQSPPQSVNVLSGMDQRHRSPDPPPRANRGHQSPLVLRKKLELAQTQSPLVQRRYMSVSPPPLLPPRTTVNSVPNSPHLRQSRINYTPELQRRIYRQQDQ